MKTKYLFLAAAIILFFLILLIIFLLPDTASYESHVDQVMQMEQTDLDSPISGIRTGLFRYVTSLGDNEFECTDDGIYYLASGQDLTAWYYNDLDSLQAGATYLFYCDHNSNQMIKLCGRPDCSHDNVSCNAAFESTIYGVTYYDEHLYVIAFANNTSFFELWRMNPDGTDREIVMDASSAYNGRCDSFFPPFFLNGVFLVNLAYMDESVEAGLVTESYYCKLDGRVDELKPTSWGSFWNDGFSFLSGSLKNIEGEIDGKWHLYNWDPDTNTREQLVEVPEYISGYWGKEAAYVHINGAVQKVNYPDGTMETVFETGLTGSYETQFYPDCIAVLENKERSPQDPAMMYFYSWEGEKLGEVEIGFNNDVGAMLFGGESKDRIMLRGSIYYSLPEYYIEKSDFGTGNIEIHKFEYPDLDEETYTAIFGEE